MAMASLTSYLGWAGLAYLSIVIRVDVAEIKAHCSECVGIGEGMQLMGVQLSEHNTQHTHARTMLYG